MVQLNSLHQVAYECHFRQTQQANRQVVASHSSRKGVIFIFRLTTTNLSKSLKLSKRPLSNPPNSLVLQAFKESGHGGPHVETPEEVGFSNMHPQRFTCPHATRPCDASGRPCCMNLPHLKHLILSLAGPGGKDVCSWGKNGSWQRRHVCSNWCEKWIT